MIEHVFEPRLDPDEPRKSSPYETLLSFGSTVLSRESKYGDGTFEKASDYFEAIPESQWDDIVVSQGEQIQEFLEGEWLTLNQGPDGSCTQEASCSLVIQNRFKVNGSKKQRVAICPRANYYVVTKGRKGGTSLDSGCRQARDAGYIPTAILPRSRAFSRQSQELWDLAQNFRADEMLDINGKEEFVTALLSGWGVIYARRNHCMKARIYLGRAAKLKRPNGSVLSSKHGDFLTHNSWGSHSNCGIPGFMLENISRDRGGSYGEFTSRSVVKASAKAMKMVADAQAA